MAFVTERSFIYRMQLRRPDITIEDAKNILKDHYHLEGTLKELGSQQDRNYRIETSDSRFVLKICRSDYSLAELEAQNLALRHLRAKSEAPLVPNVIKAINGAEIIPLAIRCQQYRVRLLEYLDGQPLNECDDLSVGSVSALGALCARLTVGLTDFEHPGLERSLQWDLRRAGPVSEYLLSATTDVHKREKIKAVMASALKRIQPLEKSLRIQTVHHDLTGDNVLITGNELPNMIPNAVIDFGDLMKGWVVGDLAVTCAWVLQGVKENVLSVLPAIIAYNTVYALNNEEISALWPLIVARAVVLVSSSAQQLSIDPSNDYVRRNLEYESKIFDLATSVHSDYMELKIREALEGLQGDSFGNEIYTSTAQHM
jgi:Ser/Thr protein kinase RdoA (MazF antagonist)